MPEKNKGLDNTTIALMICTAIFFDVLQWILVFIFMDWLAGFFAFMTFYIWFKMRGMSFAKPKRAITMGSALIIESVPLLSTFLSWLPAWTAAIVILALDSKIKKIAPKLDIIKK